MPPGTTLFTTCTHHRLRKRSPPTRTHSNRHTHYWPRSISRRASQTQPKRLMLCKLDLWKRITHHSNAVLATCSHMRLPHTSPGTIRCTPLRLRQKAASRQVNEAVGEARQMQSHAAMSPGRRQARRRAGAPKASFHSPHPHHRLHQRLQLVSWSTLWHPSCHHTMSASRLMPWHPRACQRACSRR